MPRDDDDVVHRILVSYFMHCFFYILFSSLSTLQQRRVTIDQGLPLPRGVYQPRSRDASPVPSRSNSPMPILNDRIERRRSVQEVGARPEDNLAKPKPRTRNRRAKASGHMAAQREDLRHRAGPIRDEAVEAQEVGNDKETEARAKQQAEAEAKAKAEGEARAREEADKANKSKSGKGCDVNYR